MPSLASLFKPFGSSKTDTDEEARVKSLLEKAESCLLREPPATEIHNVDFVFIHDAVVDPDETWGCLNGKEGWLKLLTETDMFPGARIFIYRYERGWVTSLANIVSPAILRENSKKLFCFLGSNDRQSRVPLVVFAHGFGGLLYEQLLVWSKSSGFGDILRNRQHTAVLFDTPHFGAGIAEWAIMIAQLHKIPCAKTAQTQDWSSLQDDILKTATMQRRLREILKTSKSKTKLIACFSSSEEYKLAPEWAVLPEFTPIAIKSSNLSITSYDQEDYAWKAITTTLASVVSQLSTMPLESVSNYTEGLADKISGSLVTSTFDKTPTPDRQKTTTISKVDGVYRRAGAGVISTLDGQFKQGTIATII